MATSTTSTDLTGLRYYWRTSMSNPFSITAGVILFMALLFSFMTLTPFGYRATEKAVKVDFVNSDKVRDAAVMAKVKTSANAAAIANQYGYFGQLKNQYLDLASAFEIYYYGFITVLVLSVVATTIFVAVIAKKGWDGQSANLQAAFYGFFFCSSMAGIFISVFNYSQNSADNINKYFYLTNLQTNIYDVIIADPVKPLLFNKDSLELAVFNANDRNLKDNMNLFLNIKSESIPAVPDISKVLGTKVGPTPSAPK